MSVKASYIWVFPISNRTASPQLVHVQVFVNCHVNRSNAKTSNQQLAFVKTCFVTVSDSVSSEDIPLVHFVPEVVYHPSCACAVASLVILRIFLNFHPSLSLFCLFPFKRRICCFLQPEHAVALFSYRQLGWYLICKKLSKTLARYWLQELRKKSSWIFGFFFNTMEVWSIVIIIKEL